MASGSTKAIIAALIANMGIAIAKFVGYVFTGSSSMLAETIHSVADTVNQGLLLFGGYRSRRDATQQHPFGYGRERYFWAFVVSLILFTLGGLFAVYEGLKKLGESGHAIENVQWAIGILLLGMLLGVTPFAPQSRNHRRSRVDRVGGSSFVILGTQSYQSCCWKTLALS